MKQRTQPGRDTYSLLESKAEIASAQRKLEAAIRQSFKGKATTNIGYPGGTERDAKVVTNGRYWFWSADHPADKTPNPRRLNWFGLMPQAGGTGVEISVEISTPYEGKNKVAGAGNHRHTHLLPDAANTTRSVLFGR